jgi:hypothetical protein
MTSVKLNSVEAKTNFLKVIEKKIEKVLDKLKVLVYINKKRIIMPSVKLNSVEAKTNFLKVIEKKIEIVTEIINSKIETGSVRFDGNGFLVILHDIYLSDYEFNLFLNEYKDCGYKEIIKVFSDYTTEKEYTKIFFKF